MSLRAYLIVMGLATVVAATTFFLVYFKVDPESVGTAGLLMFYASLFFTVTGLGAIIGFVWRTLRRRGELGSRLVGSAFRQAVLTGFLVVVAMFLQSKSLLSWWNGGVLVAAVILLELFIVSLQRRPVAH